MPRYSVQFDQHLEFKTNQSLVDDLTLEVLDSLAMQRTNRKAYKLIVEKVVVNLFVAWKNNKDKVVGFSRGKTFWDNKNPMDNRFYNNPALGYDRVTKVLDALEQKDWIKLVTKGYFDVDKNDGKTTRYIAHRKLCDAFLGHGLTLSMVRHSDSEKCVVLRAKKPRKTPTNPNPKGKKIGYKSNKKIVQMEKNLKLINWALDKAHIDLFITKAEEKKINERITKKAQREKGNIREIQYQDKSLRRIFNVDFEHGGRFYGGFWQQIPSEYRTRLTIYNSRTFEQDFSSIHFAILYNEIGQPLNQDPYLMSGSDRKTNKLVLNFMLNAEHLEACLGACRHSPDVTKPSEFRTWKDYVLHLQSHHEPIKKYFFTGYGLKLQKIDSELAEQVQLEMIEKGKVILCIHDSFVCRLRDLGDLIKCMNNASISQLGFRLFSEPKVPKIWTDEKRVEKKTEYFERRKQFFISNGLKYSHQQLQPI
jgi:hypothetical protein